MGGFGVPFGGQPEPVEDAPNSVEPDTVEDVEDVPVTRSAALIEEALNASIASSEPEPEEEVAEEPEDAPAEAV